MRTVRSIVAAPLVLILTLSAPVFAQDRHVVSPSTLSQTLAAYVAQQDAERAEIHAALNRPEVRQMAEKSGIDLDRVNASVDTLSGNSLTEVAAAAQRVNHSELVNQSLVGGASTIVISTTTIIIALLVIILIVVAVN